MDALNSPEGLEVKRIIVSFVLYRNAKPHTAAVNLFVRSLMRESGNVPPSSVAESLVLVLGNPSTHLEAVMAKVLTLWLTGGRSAGSSTIGRTYGNQTAE